VAEGEDVGWDSAMSEHRQRHPNGNAELLAQLKRHFRLGCALERSRMCAPHGFAAPGHCVLQFRGQICAAASLTAPVVSRQLHDGWRNISW